MKGIFKCTDRFCSQLSVKQSPVDRTLFQPFCLHHGRFLADEPVCLSPSECFCVIEGLGASDFARGRFITIIPAYAIYPQHYSTLPKQADPHQCTSCSSACGQCGIPVGEQAQYA